MTSDTEENPSLRRRTRSETRAEEISTKQLRQRRSQPDKPCHRPRDSLFSWSSGFHKFTGLVNWGFLLLTMSGFRLLLENLLKYGIRVDPIQWFIVLTGRDEGAGVPSIILLVCECHPIASLRLWTFFVNFLGLETHKTSFFNNNNNNNSPPRTSPVKPNLFRINNIQHL